MSDNPLKNFPEETVSYLKELSENNNRDWFEAKRELYYSAFLEPALNFVAEMGEKLSSLVPDIQAIPKIDKSVFRIHRDIRFSKNKQPYKTHLGLFFWEGKRKKMECPGFYFHLEPDYFLAGTGLYKFPKDLLRKYRIVIADSTKGKELDGIVKHILRKKKYNLGGQHYKKIPHGFDSDYPFAGYLLYDGLYVGYDSQDLGELYKNDVVNFIFRIFKDFLPLHRWLVDNL